MGENAHIDLERAVISVSGEDAYKFLQGIITNDIGKVTVDNAIYTYLLTPQGKYLFDFFVSKQGDRFFIEVAVKDKDDLLKKLKMYKLRSQVEIGDLSDSHDVYAVLGNKAAYYPDPRNGNMPNRAIHLKNFFPKEQLADMDLYTKLRIENNVPEGDDLEKDRSYPLHFRMVELNGVDFDKGCYVGQEVTTRTHHRGEIRKTVYKISSGGSLQKGSEISSEGTAVGRILTSSGNSGLALLEKGPAENPASRLVSGGSEITVSN